MVDWFFALVMGVVEGLTEFLPVSSTGHLIVTSSLFDKSDPTFEIAIQLGAISAILFLYRQRLWHAFLTIASPKDGVGQINLCWLIVAAALPASVLGLLFDEKIEELLFNNITVGIALIVGGVLLWILEKWHKKHRPADSGEADGFSIQQMTLKQALGIGLFQSLALIPGTSRAGATIAGGLVLGFGRTAAAEFSFLVGLPILYGASLLKLVKQPEIFEDSARLSEFGIASVAAFISAALVVKPFVRFLQKHSFVPFAIYRILAGGLLLGLVYFDWRGLGD